MSMKVMFMGTPDFASACLDALLDEGFDVAAAVTKPDVRKGRGMLLSYSDVKKTALARGVAVYQPETLKDGAFQPVLDEIKPDVIAVVAYGKILPEYVLNYPRYGCVNVHGSLLPQYRGAAPIQRAVLDGKAETGITTMRMDKGLDTGDMLLTERYAIGENRTTGEVFDALASLGGRLLVKTLRGLEDGSITPVPQTGEATYAEKIAPEECLVDFSRTAKRVHDLVRGMTPFPGAFTYLDGKVLKIADTLVGEKERPADAVPGEVLYAAKDGVVVACGEGTVTVRAFKPEGKGWLTAGDMVNGRKIAVGTRLTLIKE